MFIDINSIKVNNVSLGPYIVEAHFSYNKLWASDSGRNLAGAMSGTLIGIFPKIQVHFRKLTKSELEVIVPLLDGSSQTVSYYDPYKKAQTSMTTYTGDYEVVNKKIIDSIRKNEGFEVSFIATRKRT